MQLMTSPRTAEDLTHQSSSLKQQEATTAMMTATTATNVPMAAAGAPPLPIATTRWRLQRHLDALYASPRHYTDANVHTATLRSGLSMAYAVHVAPSSVQLDAPRDAPEPQREQEQGEEERVVMIMGFRQNKESWGPLVDQLLGRWKSPRRLKIVTFDNRGVGATDAPWGRYTTSLMAEDTLALMDHLGWESAHVVGISMGGMISLELASAAPRRVRSLSLLVTTRGKYVNEHGDGEMVRAIFTRDTTALINGVLSMLYPPSFLDQRMEDADEVIRDALFKFHDHRRQTITPPPFCGLLGQVCAVKTHYVSDARLADIAAQAFPVLIVGAEEDRIIPSRESALLASLMPGDHVRLAVYPQAGHGLFIQCLDELVEDLMTNISRLSVD